MDPSIGLETGGCRLFEVYCSGHGTWVLLDVSRIEAIRNTRDGPVADWHCWCGTKGSVLRGVKPVDRPGSTSSPSHAA